MKGYKAFNKGLVCRGKRYAENTVFEEEDAEICRSGMHFCKFLLDVLDYYPLIDNEGNITEFTEVEALDSAETDDGKKFCTKKLKIGSKLSLSQFIEASFDFASQNIKSQAETSDNVALVGRYNAKLAGGTCAKLVGGSHAELVGGDRAKLIGGKATTVVGGNDAAVVGGDYAILAGMYCAKLVGGDCTKLIGDAGAIVVGGNWAELVGSNDTTLVGRHNAKLVGGENAVIICDHFVISHTPFIGKHLRRTGMATNFGEG